MAVMLTALILSPLTYLVTSGNVSRDPCVDTKSDPLTEYDESSLQLWSLENKSSAEKCDYYTTRVAILKRLINPAICPGYARLTRRDASWFARMNFYQRLQIAECH